MNESATDVPIYGHALVAIGITTIFMTLNYLSIHASGNFQKVATILK